MLAMGCGPGGCSKPAGEPGAPASLRTAEPSTAPAPGGDVSDAEAEEQALLPILSKEALDARVRAQRDILGERGVLFEDGGGQPVPWISKHSSEVEKDEVAETMADDMLDMLPGSSGLGAPSDGTVSVNGNALGLYVPIEPPEEGDLPLRNFHAALHALREGKDEDGKVRVLIYGASHTGADIYPGYLRSYLQERFGDGGHGFVHVAKPYRWYRHVDMTVESSKGWRTEHVQKRNAREDGLFGLLGCSMSAKRRRDYGRVIPRNGTVGARYDLYYLVQPKGGSFRVKVDGKRVATVKTRSASVGAGYHVLELEEGPHVIEIRPVGNGEVRMFGMTIERERPGVIVDTLGIGGTRASNHLKWDEALWAEHVRRRDPDLYVLAYGTNETMDEDQPIEDYAADLRAVLERFQAAAPTASCLLVGPGDFPRRLEDGGWAPRPRLAQIIAAQRDVAAVMGCAFWDTLAFMGGPMSMPTWIASQPAMGRNDGVHLTRRGYVRMGMGLTDAIMTAFDAGDPLR
jgi:lysophospholipase L1-like esterase